MVSKLCVALLLFVGCVVIFALVYYNNSGQTEISYKTVDTENGAVRGLLKKTLLNQKEYYSFRRIPFAKPPIGELRFKRPAPAESWKPKVLDAFEYAPGCSQIYNHISPRNSSEDCLYLNVFVPAVKKSGKLPVLVFIFGGAFIGGGGDDHSTGPEFLVERDIILVTMNHRNGFFGFMSLGTPEYSGNMGLKDQQLALKWAYDNVEYFGGDKTKITLGGHSSGSVSATYHLLNEESRKYYQQALAVSGTVKDDVYFKGDFKCVINKIAQKFTNHSFGDDVNGMIAFMKNATEDEIINYTTDIVHEGTKLNTIFMPVVENENAIQPFLTEDPFKKLDEMKKINITTYFTFTDRENAHNAQVAYGDASAMDSLMHDFHYHLPINAYNYEIETKPYLKDVMNELRNFYFAEAKTDSDRIDQRIVLDSDIRFTYFIDKWVKKIAAISQRDVYYHEFSVYSMILHWHERKFQSRGATHADDICFIFSCRKKSDIYKKILETRDTDPESAMVLRVIDHTNTLLSNFVKYGKPAIYGIPVSGFKPVKRNEVNFLNISNEGLFMGRSPNDRRTKFMDYFLAKVAGLVEEHGDKPTRTFIEQFCDTFI